MCECVCVCRQRVVLDDLTDDDENNDDDVEHVDMTSPTAGCFRHRPRSDHPSSSRQPHPDGTHHHATVAEKLLRYLRPPRHQASSSGRRSPTPRPRRFMRVVKDENAPPPECVADSPYIIARYSQEYLTRHYAENGGWGVPGCHGALPYVPSGNTILKKSSTDPTSDRRATTSAAGKRTTFCDVVRVVDGEVGQVREEPLHDSEPDSDSMDGSPHQSAGFFLSALEPPESTSSEPAPAAADLQAGDDAAFREDKTDGSTKDSAGLMSVFGTAAIPEPEVAAPESPEEPKRKTSGGLSTTKHVKLVELMAQIRADDDCVRCPK